MNKISLAAAVAFATAMMTPAAQAADGTVEFVGSVTDVTCTVTDGSKNLSVTLPAVSKATLNQAGARAGRTPFTIELIDCSSSDGKVSTYFEADTNIDANGHLIPDAGGAENVNLVLFNDEHGEIKLGTDAADQNSQSVTVIGGVASLNYFAEYVATDAAEAGAVSSRVRFTIAYE
ncbi:Major fimbrial subunit precursor [compost metagenome]